MKVKRSTSTIAIIGLIGLIGAGLAGCSNGSSSGNASADKTLTVLTYQSTTKLNSVYNGFFSRCSAANKGYTFKQLVVPQAQFITKASQLTAGGTPPAILIGDNPNVATLADAGVLAPIDLKGSSLKASDFVKGPFESGQYKGVQYGLPVGNNGELIVYNKSLLTEAGITPPKSWAELTAAAAALTKGGRYGFGQTFAPDENLTWNWLSQLWSNGGSLTALSASPSVEAATFWTSFIRNGTGPRAELQWHSEDLSAQLLGGQLAMAQIGTWELPNLLAGAKKAGIELGITQQVSPDGKPPVTPFGGEVMAAGVGATGGAAKAVNDCILSFFTDPSELAKYDIALGFLPSYIPAQAAVLKQFPELNTLAGQLKNSRGRTTEVGAAYDKYSTAISTALQKIASGSASAQQALDDAAAAVK